MTPRVTFAGISGLATSPGKEGFRPGSCSVLRNFRFVAPNRLRGLRGYATPQQGGMSGGIPVRTIGLHDTKSLTIQRNNSTGAFQTYGDNITTNVYLYPSYWPTNGQMTEGKIFPLIVRDRVLVNGTYGVLVSDFINPDYTSPVQRTWRTGGLPQPQITSITEAAGESIPTGVIVTYAAVIHRVDPVDGYQLTSPPSPFIRQLNDSGAAVDNTVRVAWAYTADVKEGDRIELYRSNGIPGSTYATDTGTQCFLVATKIVNATSASNRYVDLVDLQRMTAPMYETSGGEIYTSGTQSTATQENNQPPICSAMCTWQTYTFFANISEDPVVVLDPKATVGTLSTPWERANGIGTRSGAGTVTVASPTIAGISAANLVGVKVGQLWAGPTNVFAATARVIGIGAGTITMSSNAGAAAASFSVVDTVSIDAVDYRFGSLGQLAMSLGASGKFEVHTSETIAAELTQETGITLSIRPIRHEVSMALKLTNAQNLNGEFEEWTSSSPITYGRTQQRNLIRISKYNQPEAVPYVNEMRVGQGAIISLVATTDYVYVNATDGVYWLTGSEGNWRAEPIDQSLVVASPMACSAMNERCYAISNRGLVTYDSTGVTPISRGVVDDLIPGQAYRASSSPWLQCDPSKEELWILYHGATLASESTLYLYSPRYDAFSELKLTGTDAYIKTLGITRGTTAQLPNVAVGIYVGGALAPRYSTFDDSGSFLPLVALLREAGDVAVTKQFIDFTVIFDLASAGEVVRSLVNSTAPLGTATMVTARTDSRANFGIPRSDAVRPQLSAGFAVEAPTRVIDVLGLSLRVVPKTTQEVVR